MKDCVGYHWSAPRSAEHLFSFFFDMYSIGSDELLDFIHLMLTIQMTRMHSIQHDLRQGPPKIRIPVPIHKITSPMRTWIGSVYQYLPFPNIPDHNSRVTRFYKSSNDRA